LTKELRFRARRGAGKSIARVFGPALRKILLRDAAKSFGAHPYKRPGIGSIEDLQAATVENVKKFHSTYYRPDKRR
jgi:predicted Zn-dependent peptidase